MQTAAVRYIGIYDWFKLDVIMTGLRLTVLYDELQ